MEKAHEINLSKKECKKETIKFIENLDNGKIINETDSSIEFQKGKYWSLETSVTKAVIHEIITFEGNGQTKVKMRSDNKNLFFKDLAFAMIATFIFEIIVGIIIPLQLVPAHAEYLKGEMTYDTYLMIWNVWMGVMIFLLVLIPIIFAISLLYTYLHEKPKAHKILLEQLISRLKTRSQEIVQKEYHSEKVTIKERIKVIYDLPEKCPSCSVPLKYENIKMRGPTKAECGYCNSMFDLLEKEI